MCERGPYEALVAGWAGLYMTKAAEHRMKTTISRTKIMMAAMRDEMVTVCAAKGGQRCAACQQPCLYVLVLVLGLA